MAKDIPRASVTLLLAATMLAWGFLPPAIQHAHEGGTDLRHHHDGPDEHQPGSDWAPASYHGVECRETHAAAIRPDVIASRDSHFHFEWLGFRLTLPDSDSPAKKGEDRCVAKPLLLRAGSDSAPQVQSGGRLDKSLTSLPLNAMAADSAAACPARSCFLLPVVPHPLCDRARHERSGVQLA